VLSAEGIGGSRKTAQYLQRIPDLLDSADKIVGE
jgi:hypothetical protein